MHAQVCQTFTAQDPKEKFGVYSGHKFLKTYDKIAITSAVTTATDQVMK